MNDQTLFQDTPGGYRLRSLKTGEEYPVTQEMLVGREVECQISLDSGHISRYHAKLSLTPEGVMVEDLRSTNGTFINGRRITAPQTLSIGDEVRFHEQAFRLVTNQSHSGDADATVFHTMNTDVRPAEPSFQVRQPARPMVDPQQKTQIPADDDGSGTRILSLSELQRLEGKGERAVKGPDNGSGPRFVVLSAPIRGKVFSLISQQRNAWLIGRDEKCQFNLSDRTVSGEHARVRKLGDDWVLESCEGRNPIFINNRPIEISTLQPGDVVRIGRMEMMFRVDERAILTPIPKVQTMLWSRFNLALVVGAMLVLGLVLGILLVA
ncbi:MAG TPA: FHA domain-containing protein [Dongiaceae bacterium]|nr:FHA domain-containing protein [Dongiaceae bacterium]